MRTLLRVGSTFAALAFSVPSLAGVVVSDPRLPPVAGVYRTPADVHADYAAGGNVLSLQNILHYGFSNVVISNLPPNEREQFDSILEGDALLNGSFVGHLAVNAAVDTLVFNKSGLTTGTFQTEMLALSLTASTTVGPVMIRESPTLASTGMTTVAALGGGQYRIDSFFDVFTELSFDGGQSWIPSTGPARVELVPEPSSLILLLCGLLAVGWAVRRRADRRGRIRIIA